VLILLTYINGLHLDAFGHGNVAVTAAEKLEEIPDCYRTVIEYIFLV